MAFGSKLFPPTASPRELNRLHAAQRRSRLTSSFLVRSAGTLHNPRRVTWSIHNNSSDYRSPHDMFAKPRTAAAMPWPPSRFIRAVCAGHRIAPAPSSDGAVEGDLGCNGQRGQPLQHWPVVGGEDADNSLARRGRQAHAV